MSDQAQLTDESGGPFWSQPAVKILERLGTTSNGLSSDAVRERIERCGPNVIHDQTQVTGIRLLLWQFESPLVLILVFGAVISLTLREIADAAIILAIVSGSTLLGFYQENRASQAVRELKRRLALISRVVRDDAETVIAASEIVPGDIVILSAGNLVPADGILLEARDFLVTEATLTGESFPVEKQAGIVPENTPIAGRTNTVFLGSSVRSGTARIAVVRTGRTTEFGAIAGRLLRQPPETDFARGVRQFGVMLLRVMVFIILFVLTVNQMLGRPAVDSLLFAVALAVGLSPELLPAIVTVTLSAGARSLAERGVIVRRLDAIENLGSMDVLCTDKTGTLTEGSVVLESVVDQNGKSSAFVRHLAFLNAAFETGIENPLDAAIVALGKQECLSTDGFRKVDEIPYDFRRKYLTRYAPLARGNGSGATDRRRDEDRVCQGLLAVCDVDTRRSVGAVGRNERASWCLMFKA